MAEILLSHYWDTTESLLRHYWDTTETWWDVTETMVIYSWDFTEILMKHYWDIAETLLRHYWDTTELRPLGTSETKCLNQSVTRKKERQAFSLTGVWVHVWCCTWLQQVAAAAVTAQSRDGLCIVAKEKKVPFGTAMKQRVQSLL